MNIKVIPKTVNLTIYRGDDVDLLLKVRLPEELDIKDISFAMSFGSGSGRYGVIAEATAIPTGAFTWEAGIDGEAGNLLIKISGDLTAPIDWRVGAYDLQAQFAGRRLTLCRGSLTIIPDVTK